MYKPKPFTTAMQLLRARQEMRAGVPVKTYEDGPVLYGSFAAYGGTESQINGVYSILDTATVETWYCKEITAADRIRRLPDGAVYEIKGEPENIDMRGLYTKLKLQRVKGGA